MAKNKEKLIYYGGVTRAMLKISFLGVAVVLSLFLRVYQFGKRI